MARGAVGLGPGPHSVLPWVFSSLKSPTAYFQFSSADPLSPSPQIPTPRLSALLDHLRAALVRQVWLHGLGSLLVGACVWLMGMYATDLLLDLPRIPRLINSTLLVGLIVVLLRTHLQRPLGSMPGPAGLARLVEQAHPGSHDLLVSAVQLNTRGADGIRGDLVKAVVEQAEQRAGSLKHHPVLRPRGPRARMLAGLAALVLCTLTLGARPALTQIFLQRALGLDLAWPQATHLFIEVPSVGAQLRVEQEEEQLHIYAARGSDVSVLIRAEGVIPEHVQLNFDSGHQSLLTSGGTPLFRTLLRSVQEDMGFYVTGGDHTDVAMRAQLTVLQPPDVAGIAWEVTPPKYTGLRPTVSNNPDIEVLQNSTVRVSILPTPSSATGSARLLPADETLALTAGSFPGGNENEGERGLGFELLAEQSLRVTFDLVDDSGLPNPNPGLYALSVVNDRRPEVFLLAPTAAEVDIVAGGAIPLRVRVEDDFAIAQIQWKLSDEQKDGVLIRESPLSSTAIPHTAESSNSSGDRHIAATRLEVDELSGLGVPAVGTSWVLRVEAVDSRQPKAGVTLSAPVHLRVVSSDEYLRDLKDQLARAGERASSTYDLGRSQVNAIRQLVASLAPSKGSDAEPNPGATESTPDPAPGGISGSPEYGPALHGAKRLQGDVHALGRELALITSGLLYTRIDSRGGALLDHLERGQSMQSRRGFSPAPWRALGAAYQAGELGQAELAGDLVEMVTLALSVSEDHAKQASILLSDARDAANPARRLALTEDALIAQVNAQKGLDALLTKLGEWDNFQSILTLTRDILNHQRSLKQRTQRFAEDN